MVLVVLWGLSISAFVLTIVIVTVLDTGNFFVIPGLPVEVWTAEKYKLSHSRERLRAQFRLQPDDSVIVVVGSPFLYRGLWREHALVMRALARAVSKVCDVSTKGGRRIQLLIIGHGNQSSSYGAALQVMAEACLDRQDLQSDLENGSFFVPVSTMNGNFLNVKSLRMSICQYFLCNTSRFNPLEPPDHLTKMEDILIKRCKVILDPQSAFVDPECFKIDNHLDLQPFYDIQVGVVRKVREKLRIGERPVLLRPGLKELMEDCWALNPASRPKFEEIQERLWEVKKQLEVPSN